MRVEYRIEPCKSALNAGPRHAVQVVAQPVHGLRAPLHVLLRPRTSSSEPTGRRTTATGARSASRSNVAEVLRARARATVVAARGGRARHRDRSVPAGGGAFPPHARVHRRARARLERLLDRHARAADRARHRRPADGDEPRRRRRVFSLPTLDERVWRTTEPGTAPPAAGSRAIRALADAGIEVGVGMAPVLPGLSDDPEQLEAVVRAARAAGARTIWASVVHLRPGVREHFLEALAQGLARGGCAVRGALCARAPT